MTEAQVTGKLHAYLKQALPGAVIVKTSDRITKGVPDSFVAWDGKTVWLEIKVLRDRETPATRVAKDKLQLLTMQRLHAQTGGRAWYVFYDLRTPHRATAIYAPHQVTKPEGDAFEHATAVALGLRHDAVVRLLETV